ncbi:NnrS family protein [Marinimicrobium locisalis]|uniref:NnrS family protein n=1 Tax=Marinimicrobium locisalis TaxID=546022 RepID=UPI003D2FE3D7
MPPYRPFFLLTGLAAIAGGLIWWIPLPASRQIFLHLHLLLFGMGGAAVAGYLLTALPSWVGRSAIPPTLVWVLVVLWLLARGLPFLGDDLPSTFLLIIGPSFTLVLTVFLLLRVIEAAAWSRLHLAAAPLLLAFAEVMLLQTWLFDNGTATATSWAGVAFGLLIVLVGGRAIPAFTRNALTLHARPSTLRAPLALQTTSVVMLLITLATLPFPKLRVTTGSLPLITGALQLVRLAGWKPLTAWRLSSLAMLQLAWVWLGVGLILMGAALCWPQLMRLGVVLHALTMGAMGAMILGFASRAAMHRSAQGLKPRRVQTLAGAFILLSPALRLLPPGVFPVDTLAWSALFWATGWLLFLKGLWPALHGPVPRPVLSGVRPSTQLSRHTRRREEDRKT